MGNKRRSYTPARIVVCSEEGKGKEKPPPTGAQILLRTETYAPVTIKGMQAVRHPKKKNSSSACFSLQCPIPLGSLAANANGRSNRIHYSDRWCCANCRPAKCCKLQKGITTRCCSPTSSPFNRPSSVGTAKPACNVKWGQRTHTHTRGGNRISARHLRREVTGGVAVVERKRESAPAGWRAVHSVDDVSVALPFSCAIFWHLAFFVFASWNRDHLSDVMEWSCLHHAKSTFDHLITSATSWQCKSHY